MEKWLLARFNSIIEKLIFTVIWTGGATVGAMLKALPIPVIILIALVVFVTILFFIKVALRFRIKYVVKRLLSIGIYTDCPINVTRILYHDREKLAVGLSDEVASVQDKLVFAQLNLREIVRLEQRKVKVFGSDNIRDEGYWILTELGKEVIKYLQENQQVLHKEGSRAE